MTPLELARRWAEEGTLNADRLRTLLGYVEDPEAFVRQLEELGINVKAPGRREKGHDEDAAEE